MRIRYSAGLDGRHEKKAFVYTGSEHGIDTGSVDRDAILVVEKLRANGFDSYIVGGAVRDLILKKTPKDFDIVSEASPPKIKKIFRNARIIGRRFRLVHVYFGSKIFEVSTFRSLRDGTTSNTFGTIDEDVLRRDFSLNALFYDPTKNEVIDYVGGLRDIRARKIRPVINPAVIFRDDPVRMLRAVKYAAATGFSLPLSLRWKIRAESRLLTDISPSRLTEEMMKIIRSPVAAEIVEQLDAYHLYAALQPGAAKLMHESEGFRERYFRGLRALAPDGKNGSGDNPGEGMAALVRDYLEEYIDWEAGAHENYKTAFYAARKFVLPMNPPRMELERAVRLIFSEHGVILKKSRLRERNFAGETDTPPEDAASALPARRKRRRKRRGGAKSAAVPPGGDG